MKQYTVMNVAKVSGVSVRTLHHYDAIGLLMPQCRTDAGYRLYGEKELLRLQQILFYRQMGMALDEIGEILDDPEFDTVAALKAHREVVLSEKVRFDRLLVTIDTTILSLEKGTGIMKTEELYNGFKGDTAKKYRDEAVAKFGSAAVEKSERELTKLGRDGFTALQRDAEQNHDRLFALRNEDPEGEAVQAEIARHYTIIRRFWGTASSPDKQAAAYAGLGELYVQDERYTLRDGSTQPRYAQFLCRAMKYYSEKNLK